MAQSEQEILEGLAEIVNEETGLAVDAVQSDKSFTDDLDIDSLSMMTIVVNAEEKFDEALPRFLKARELAPESAPLLIDLAVCYEAKGDRQSARPYWEQALAKTTDPKTRACIDKHLKK